MPSQDIRTEDPMVPSAPEKSVKTDDTKSRTSGKIKDTDLEQVHNVDPNESTRSKDSKLLLPASKIDIDDNALDTFFKNRKKTTFSSSFMRPGSKFMGTQQSGQSTYDVEIEIKHVDLDNAFICGYLRIEGLTEDHPTLTTYFEGEMVSEKYSFYTKHADWGATASTDINHWSRFRPWRTISDQAKEPNYVHKNFQQQDHIFMRWKESFLVPDHRIHEVSGASYAGFYYICFDQVNGCISGFYFHQNWDKFQQLELSHVSQATNFQTFEFR